MSLWWTTSAARIIDVSFTLFDLTIIISSYGDYLDNVSIVRTYTSDQR